MKTVINLALLLAAIGLLYLLGYGFYEPIQFKSEWESREAQVRDHLIDIRKAQQAYRGIVGEYAPTFDTLAEVLTTSEFKITKVFGDPDATDPSEQVRFEDAYVNSTDSMLTIFSKSIGIDKSAVSSMGDEEKKQKLKDYFNELKIIPNSDGEEFKVEAYMIDYQKTKVPVVQVSAPVKSYMGKFASDKYKRHDPSYEPTAILKFGDLTKPSTAGNWRQQTREDEG